jgi:XTP/dITP diphosphohydrolase
VSGAPPRDRPRIVIATRSAHKLRELRELLSLEHADLVSLDELGVEGDPVEDGETFETNARIKARFAAQATGLAALADDSGIEVDALGGQPGVRTRRYAGEQATDVQNNRKLLGALDGLPPERRGARYVCVLAFTAPSPDGAAARIVTARGTCRGRIAAAPKGSGGFGYDPIFEPEGLEVTAAELPPAEKDARSHRAKAFVELLPELERVAGRIGG